MYMQSRIFRSGGRLPFIGMTALCIGCSPEPELELEPTLPMQEEPLQCDIPTLFEERCGTSNCHAAGGTLAAALDLTSPGVEDRVSGAPGNNCVGVLADPADPESSLLYSKLVATPTCGARMPLGGEPLNEDELDCMRDWISGLLPPIGDGCEACICEPGMIADCYGGPGKTADVGECMSGSHTCQTSGLGWTKCEGEIWPLGENCFTADIDENCDGITPACSESWALGFGDDKVQAMRSVAVDSIGNVYVLGDFEGVGYFGGEPLTATQDKADLVITKHDHFGNPIWSRQWGDNSNQYGAKVIIDDDDNLVLAARIYGKVDFGGGELDSTGGGDILLVKLDGEGEHIWSRLFGDPAPDRAERLVFDNQGDVVMTGTFSGTIDFGGGSFSSKGMRDAFVVELDGETGEHVFSRQIGGPGDDQGAGVDVDAIGHILIAGRFQDSVDLGINLVSTGGSDIYLAKLNQEGEPMWSRKFGGDGEEQVHDLKLQQNGDIVLIGGMGETMDFGGPPLVSAGEGDIFVATLASDGSHVWSANYGDGVDQFSGNFQTNTWLTLALGGGGAIHVAGPLLGTVDFGEVSLSSAGPDSDVFQFTLAADGSFLGGDNYGGTSSDFALDVITADPSHAILVGRSYGTQIDFGDAGRVINAGAGDGFIVKLPVP
jgi:hypothetical protein